MEVVVNCDANFFNRILKIIPLVIIIFISLAIIMGQSGTHAARIS